MCENLIWILSCVFLVMAWCFRIVILENQKLLKELNEAKSSNKELLEANYKLCRNIDVTYKIVK